MPIYPISPLFEPGERPLINPLDTPILFALVHISHTLNVAEASRPRTLALATNDSLSAHKFRKALLTEIARAKLKCEGTPEKLRVLSFTLQITACGTTAEGE